jgi:ankyrin repeat protein
MAQQLDTALTKHKCPHLAKLLEAAKTCKHGPLMRYLEAGGTPDTVVQLESSGSKTFRVPLLHSAVVNHHHDRGAEHAESIEILLSAGARLDTVGYSSKGNDCSCVMWAAEMTCCTEPLKLLLQRGADPCYQSRADGLTALHKAAVHGLPENCHLLLSASSGKALHQGVNGLTPLYLAVAKGQIEVVKVLVQHGAGLQTTGSQREGLLQVAVAADWPEISNKQNILPMLRYLLREGLNVNARSSDGAAALSAAASSNNTAAMQLLFEHGAGTDVSALSSACQDGHSAVLELLLQHGADITVSVKAGDCLGVTMLMLAVNNGHIDAANSTAS